jgi:hypothetical protein
MEIIFLRIEIIEGYYATESDPGPRPSPPLSLPVTTPVTAGDDRSRGDYAFP